MLLKLKNRGGVKCATFQRFPADATCVLVVRKLWLFDLQKWTGSARSGWGNGDGPLSRKEILWKLPAAEPTR